MLLREAKRVAPELVVLEPAVTMLGRSEAEEERLLLDGSRQPGTNSPAPVTCQRGRRPYPGTGFFSVYLRLL
jgi:hypothetical protein